MTTAPTASLPSFSKTLWRNCGPGAPLTVANLASVAQGPQFRRSVLEKDGSEAVGAVVMMRYGENPLAVAQAIKAKIAQLQPGLPQGVRIVPFYDRTRLVEGAVHTLVETLATEMLIASVAILLILMHLRMRRGDLPHLAAGRARLVHPHAAIRRRLEHHVPVRHRHSRSACWSIRRS